MHTYDAVFICIWRNKSVLFNFKINSYVNVIHELILCSSPFWEATNYLSQIPWRCWRWYQQYSFLIYLLSMPTMWTTAVLKFVFNCCDVYYMSKGISPWPCCIYSMQCGLQVWSNQSLHLYLFVYVHRSVGLIM